MKPPHITIRTMTFVVSLVALDAAVLRFVFVNGPDGVRRHVNSYLAMSTLPMASLLALGLYRMFSRHAEKRNFLVEFEVAGLTAVLATACFFLLTPAQWGVNLAHTLDRSMTSLLMATPPFGEWRTISSYERPIYAKVLLFATVQLTCIGLFYPSAVDSRLGRGRAGQDDHQEAGGSPAGEDLRG
jgi:hypothetical protein